MKAGGYGITWNNELHLDVETIRKEGIMVESEEKPDLNHLLAYRLLLARNQAGMTQKELSEKTGIYQADISKLERGIGNPSIATLQRLANAMDMILEIQFKSKSASIDKKKENEKVLENVCTRI